MIGGVNRFAHLQSAALTDMGRKRKNNEDSYGAFPAYGVWCVADGMGGGDDGEVASAAVVKSVDAYLSDLPEVAGGAYAGDAIVKGVITSLEEASAWIFRRTKKNKLKGSGSTFVGIVFDATSPAAAIAMHVGDSRLYRLRGREFRQITKDHSVAEMMGAKDESQLNPMFRGMILRAVGIENTVEVEQTPLSVEKGDIILICSDGLSRMVPDKRISEIIRDNDDNLDAAVKKLIAEANDAGGIDNITVELIKVGALPPPMKESEMTQNEDISASSAPSSTSQTLDREYGSGRKLFSYKTLAIVASIGAIVAFGWAISRPLMQSKPMASVAPVIEAMPSAETNRSDTLATVAEEETVTNVVTEVVAETNVEVAVASTNVQPAVAVAASDEDRERNEVEEELKAERERRKRAEDVAVKKEEERREIAQALARAYDHEFIEFANFINVVFGRGASERAYSLCRKLHDRKDDVDAIMCATDFTTEIAIVATKLAAKCEERSGQHAYAAAMLADKCNAIVEKDPALPKTQRACLELMKFVADLRAHNHGRK